MQIPPYTFADISLLIVMMAIILRFTAEMSSPHYGLTNLIINKRKLRNAAFALSILFFVVVAIEIISLFIKP